MKKVIKASDLNEYSVTVNFAGFIGADEEYTEYAENEEDAISQALEDARDDFSVDDIEDNDDGSYDVTISFAGFIGTEETYTVYADDEDEASDSALEEAYSDLAGEIYSEDEEDEEDEE